MIHPTAIIDPAAVIGPDVSIGPFTVVEGPVHVGVGTRIGNNVSLSGDTRIGEACVIHPFCSIGAPPQDFSYTPEVHSGVRIGNCCEFREGVTVHRGAANGGMTQIGNGVYLMTGCHAGHDSVIEDGVTMANSTHLGGYSRVGEGATLSGNISVHQHVRVGSWSMTSASSFLNRDLPPYFMAFGVPAVVAGLNSIGLKRNGFDAEARKRIKLAFRILYRSGHSVGRALELLEGLEGPEAALLLGFIRSSGRGILAGRRSRDVGGC